jgi:hypothetical protein
MVAGWVGDRMGGGEYDEIMLYLVVQAKRESRE